MNTKYDRLARYPYDDQETRALIDKYLNDDEIEYLIEYSIAPVLIKDFIEVRDFNVYHAGDYYNLAQRKWELSNKEIVEITEKTIDFMPMDDLVKYLDNYSYDELDAWLDKGSKLEDCPLLLDAGSMDAYVDDEVTLYRRVPFHLESLSDEVPGDSSVIVDRAIQQPLLNMCAVIQNDLESEDLCGGLYVETGYVSYESQKALFDEAKRMYGNDAIRNSFEAGHSEHQLGLAIDFKKDEDFVESDAYKWLKKNAYRYGFIESYTSKNEYVTNKEPNPYHWRYVGEDVAQMLMVRDISLKDYTEMKE